MCLFKNRKVTVYTLLYKGDETSDFEIVTVAEKKKQLIEYLYYFLKQKHLEHYTMWCQIHNKEDSDKVFAEYATTVLIDEISKYYFFKRHLKTSEVACMFRLMTACVPLPVSFIDSHEISQYVQMHMMSKTSEGKGNIQK